MIAPARSRKTTRGYEQQSACLLKFAETSVEELTQSDVDRFRRAAQDGTVGLSPVSVEAAVKAAGLLRREKFGGEKLHRPRGRNRTIPLDELSKVYAVAKKRQNVRICLFLKWAYVTGFRLGDLMSLTRDQMAADVIELDATKTRKYHAIPRHPILQRRLPDCERPFKRSPGRLRKKIGYYCDLAGVPYFTPQMIRRTAATQYELARPGAGEIIQGSGLKRRAEVAWKYYFDQVSILTEAQLRLAIPESMRPKSLQTRRRMERKQLIAAFDRISATERETLLRMVSRLS